MAGFAHKALSAGFPGWDGKIPSNDGTIAEILKANGYNTFAVGKYGVTPDEENNSAGPFDHWPSAKGFEHFFGFLGSQTDQYKPDLAEDDTRVTPDGRHLNDQITDKAIFYIERQKKAAPDKPFFLYYSPAQYMRRTRCLMNGVTSIKASLMKAGIYIVKKFLPIKRSWGCCHLMRGYPNAIQYKSMEYTFCR
jgi:hypothetical protein